MPVGALVAIGLLVGIGLAGPFETLPSILMFLGAVPVCAVILHRTARLTARGNEWIAQVTLGALVAAASALLAGTAVAIEALEDTGTIDTFSSGDKVQDYCQYGAKSHAQLQGCLSHVTIGDVDTRISNAAEYARGVLDECRSDAGPFCDDR